MNWCTITIDLQKGRNKVGLDRTVGRLKTRIFFNANLLKLSFKTFLEQETLFLVIVRNFRNSCGIQVSWRLAESAI